MRQIESAQEFLDVVGDALLVDEIRYGMPFGIAERAVQDPHFYGPVDPWFLLIEESRNVLATAIRTPPLQIILSHLAGDPALIAAELARSIYTVTPTLPGAVGDHAIVDAFAQQWADLSGQQVVDVMAQRIYQLTEVIDPNFADGRLRQATLADSDQVIAWAAAFHHEAVGDELSANHQQRYRDRIQTGDIYLWDHDGPVSMAARLRPTDRGVSIGSVYTPPEQRNHGYASSCVAALCQRLLGDYDYCVLYTDLSNPVSNSIYQRIGFKPHCDSVQYTFG